VAAASARREGRDGGALNHRPMLPREAAERPTAGPQPRPARSGITLRVVLVSLVLMPLNCWWVLQMEIVFYSAQPTTIALYFHVIFTLLVLLLVNTLLRRWAPRWALERNEFLVLYVMLTIATSLTSHDQMEILVPMMAWGTWYASPENRWHELFDRFLPDYMVVKDRAALQGFFEGNSSMFTSQVLLAWAKPVAVWAAFILVLFLTTLCINAVLRRQWTERERLSYPIIQIPLEISDPDSRLWRNRLLWIGFGLAAAIDTLNGFSFLYPSVPYLSVRQNDIGRYFVSWPWTVLAGSQMTFYPFAVGLGYLLPVDLLFSAWFFYWVWKAQILIAAATGWAVHPGAPYVNEQSFGGYMGIALFALWIGRGHLRAVFRKALGLERSLDDSAEPMPYRLAAFGMLAGGALMIGFALFAGMPAWIAFAFFIIYFGLMVAVTRMRAELGPPAHDLHNAGPDLVMTKTLGSDAMGPRALSLFSTFFWMNRAYRSQPMPFELEGYKIAERRRLSMRGLTWAMLLACVVGIICGFWMLIYSGYHYGWGTAKIGAAGTAFGREPWDRLGAWMTARVRPSFATGVAAVTGTAFTLLLMFLRTRFLWWPFHPVGYAVSASWSMNLLWMPLFIAWVAKLLMLRYGGLRFYRLALPFFLGLILGEFVTGGLWSILGVLMQRKVYVFWPY